MMKPFAVWTPKARTRRRQVKLKGLASVALALVFSHTACANAMPNAAKIDAYFRPYVATNNFSGTVLVKRGQTVLFAKSYGLADRDKRIPNRLDTRFHIASISILF